MFTSREFEASYEAMLYFTPGSEVPGGLEREDHHRRRT